MKLIFDVSTAQTKSEMPLRRFNYYRVNAEATETILKNISEIFRKLHSKTKLLYIRESGKFPQEADEAAGDRRI